MGAYPLGWGEKQPGLVAVDLGSGEPVALGYVDEKDPQAVHRFLEPLVKQWGCERDRQRRSSRLTQRNR